MDWVSSHSPIYGFKIVDRIFFSTKNKIPKAQFTCLHKWVGRWKMNCMFHWPHTSYVNTWCAVYKCALIYEPNMTTYPVHGYT